MALLGQGKRSLEFSWPLPDPQTQLRIWFITPSQQQASKRIIFLLHFVPKTTPMSRTVFFLANSKKLNPFATAFNFGRQHFKRTTNWTSIGRWIHIGFTKAMRQFLPHGSLSFSVADLMPKYAKTSWSIGDYYGLLVILTKKKKSIKKLYWCYLVFLH